MIKKIISLILCCVISTAAFSQFGKTKKEKAAALLQAGAAKILITPSFPTPMSGYGSRKAPFKGVHDDIFARVVAFSDGVNKAILITTDLIGISNSFWEETTQFITKETGIKKEYILLSAVHNHSGPSIKVYEKNSPPEVDIYIQELKGKIVAATKEAVTNLVPVSIGTGKGECKMNINRRMPNGNGQISLGRNPYAPCDHEVSVITVEEKCGDPIAMIINWPCHGTVIGPSNSLISGDWPGATSTYVEEAFGGKLIAPIIIGASGDINPIYGPHIDFEKNSPNSSYSYAVDAIGEDLGKESMRVSKNLLTFSSGKITALQRVIALPMKERETGNYQQPESTGDSVLVRLSAIKIGNIVLTGVSGEVFNQIGVKMRNQSPYAFTVMITHCNGSSGYLVTEDAYPKPGVNGYENKYAPAGGYEASSTRVKTGAEKAIINNLLEMINDL